MASGLFRSPEGSSGSRLHVSDLPTACILPTCLLIAMFNSTVPLSPIYYNLCTVSLGFIMSSVHSYATTSSSSSSVSLIRLALAAFALFVLPSTSRSNSYAIYWAIICLHPSVQSITKAFPRSFTFGEASILCEAALLLSTGILLNFLSLHQWTMKSAIISLVAISQESIRELYDQGFIVISLLLLWMVLGIISIALVPLYNHFKWPVTTRTRKIFHLAVVIVYSTGLAFSPLLLVIASIGATVALVGLELFRISNILPVVSNYLTNVLGPFLDNKEGGDLILTHIYLLIGVSWPLWIWPGSVSSSSLPIYSGLISVGVMDSAASVIGSKIGRIRWGLGSGRTVEGSFGGWSIAMLYVYILSTLGLVTIRSWSILGSALAIVSLTEAVCDQVDNLVLPLVTYCVLRLSE